MTGNLDMMMQLRNQQILNDMRKDANIQVAEDVGKMAELGYFDVEFTMYGCAYLNPADNKMYYKVSSMAEDIYDFIEKSSQQKIYPGNVMQFTRKCPVPSGMKNLIAQDVKWELVQELKHAYPKAFFYELYKLAEECTTDSASAMLWEETEALEGVFEEEKLSRFEELVHYVHSCRNISDTSYKALLEWITEERRNMNDDFISKDMFEKTLYGLAYVQGNTVKYIENAQREYIYEKLYKVEQQGDFVLPIYTKTYWYNYEYRLQDVKKDFKEDLRNARNSVYLDKIRTLRGTEKKISSDRFQNLVTEMKSRWGEKPAETLIRYGNRWRVYA